MRVQAIEDPSILATIYGDHWRRLTQHQRDTIGALAVAFVAAAIRSETPDLGDAEREVADRAADAYTDMLLEATVQAIPEFFPK